MGVRSLVLAVSLSLLAAPVRADDMNAAKQMFREGTRSMTSESSSIT